MSELSRRDFLKVFTATVAALAVPIVAESQRRLELTVEIDDAKLGEAFMLHIGDHKFEGGKVTACVSAVIDEAKIWRAVYATDQWGRHWTTPDGLSWSCGEDSFVLGG